METRQSCTAIVILAAVTGLVNASAADASFPGRNGRIAFVHDNRIHDVRPSGRGARMLTDEAFLDHPAYSPNGRRLTVESDSNTTAVLAADGTGFMRLRTDEVHHDPAFSPDGKRIVAEGGDVLISFDAGTGRQPTWFGDSEAEAAAWSTSGLIAFTRVVQNGPEDDCGYDLREDLSDVFISTPRGKRRRRLTTTYGSSDPDWSPDASKLVFARNRTLDSRDFDPDEEELRAADDMCKQAAAVRRDIEPGPESDVYVIAAVGRGMRRLVRNGHSPVWSPDGKRIAFVRGAWIYVANSDGSNRHRIVRGTSPAWQPLR